MRVAILGAGGHGHDIAGILISAGHSPTFYDDTRPGPDCNEVTESYLIGVNDPATRRRMAEAAEDRDPDPVPFDAIDPSASVSRDGIRQFGIVIGAGAHIGPGHYLGDHVHIGAGVTMTRTTVGAYTTIAPGVDIAGDVTIGEECLIGIGASISNLITIGDRCVIGAGAVVIDDVPDDTTVVGVPARPLLQRQETS